jgi:hypothetical protein
MAAAMGAAVRARKEKDEVMKNVLSLSLVALLALAGACNQKQDAAAKNDPATPASTTAPAVATAQVLTPEQLGELGAQIRKTPDRSHELLTHHGLDEKTFESQIRKVTESPDASKRYAEAYRKAST